MRQAEKRNFVPRFVPRSWLRYPHQSGQTAIGLTEPHGPELAYLDDNLLLNLDDDKVVLFDLRAVVAFFWWGDVLA